MIEKPTNTVLAWALQISGLLLIGVIPFIADYAVLLIALLGLGLGLWTRSPLLRTPATGLVFASALLLAATLPFVFRGLIDLVPLGAVLLLLLTIPGGAVILARQPASLRPLRFHILCLAGATLAVGLGLVEFLKTGSTRVGLGNNPIHYAALAVMLGYLALPGIGATQRPWRIAFLLGPVMAVSAALLSGSRGPLLAAVVLALGTGMVLLMWFRRDRTVMLTLLGIAVAGTAGLLALNTSGRALSIFKAIASGKQGPIDAYRAAMYQTAMQVLQSTPWHGLGFGQVMPAVVAGFPELRYMPTLHDLHSDVANFSAAAGWPGLLAYILVMAAPLTLWRRGRRGLNMTLLALVGGQLTLGLTNTVFGILPQTMLYVCAFAYCLAASSAVPREDEAFELAAKHISR